MTENTIYESFAYKKKNFYDTANENDKAVCNAFSEDYKKYLDVSKTEREGIKYSIELAEQNGFLPYSFGMELKPGDKYYYNNRGRNLYVFTVGSDDINNGLRIIAAHSDNPRIDLKQIPLYEEGGFGYFKVRPYGGLRKYQWVAMPLALHGTVVKKDGTKVDICIGENENDPVFYITDIAPHISDDQGKQPLNTAIPSESLNIMLGSVPANDADSDKIKKNILKLLNEKYGIVEEDFLSADIFAVPAGKAKDVGFDRSLISAYGHDDRVCAYSTLKAVFESAGGKNTCVGVLVDKEEIGSVGNTSMNCMLFEDLLGEIISALGGRYSTAMANSKAISADVCTCFDPNFASHYDPKNSAYINCGVAMSKYTGSGNKVGTNDAPAEYIAWIRNIFEKENVLWQTGDLGRNDCGGGGTVAKYIANRNIETVDIGVPVISMHAPFELISKADLYSAYKAYLAFCRA